MALKSSGGIKLPVYKNTLNIPITISNKPKKVYFCLKDGMTASVMCGDYVKRYGKIAANEDGFCLYASVSGKVIYSDNRYIAVENDLTYTSESPDSNKPSDIKMLDCEKLAEYVKEYGIVGSFSGIPLYKKILSAFGKCERIIINCMESEPCSGHIRTMARTNIKQLVLGAKIMMHAMKVKKCVFAVGNNDRETQKAIYKETEGENNFISAPIQERYPSGNERLIVNAIYNCEASCDDELWEIGYPVFSAETIINVFNSLNEGLPIVQKTLTVSGDAVETPKNICVPIGTPASYLFEETGIKEKINCCFVKNSILNGSVADENTPVDGSTNSFYAIKDFKQRIGSCIKCARCATHCPMNLVPFLFHRNHERSKTENSIKHGLYNCIECGICSYVCIGKVDLLGEIREDKYYSLTEDKASSDTKVFDIINIEKNREKEEPEALDEENFTEQNKSVEHDENISVEGGTDNE